MTETQGIHWGLLDVLEERQLTHGDFSRNAETAQAIKHLLFEANRYAMRASQPEALDLIATKLARIVTGNPDEPDHWRDIAGYATLVLGELTDD